MKVVGVLLVAFLCFGTIDGASIIVTNASNRTAPANFPVRVFIESALWLKDKVITDCNAVEFRDENNAIVPYFQETKCPAGQTFYWVQLSLPPNSKKTLKVVQGSSPTRSTTFDVMFPTKFADVAEFSNFKREKLGFIQPFILPNLETLVDANLATGDTFTNASFTSYYQSFFTPTPLTLAFNATVTANLNFNVKFFDATQINVASNVITPQNVNTTLAPGAYIIELEVNAANLNGALTVQSFNFNGSTTFPNLFKVDTSLTNNYQYVVQVLEFDQAAAADTDNGLPATTVAAIVVPVLLFTFGAIGVVLGIYYGTRWAKRRGAAEVNGTSITA